MGSQAKAVDTSAAVKGQVQEFVRVTQELQMLFESNPDLFQRFFEMADQYNAALTAAKDAIRDVPGYEKISFGPFTRLAPVLTKTYDATKLPPAVLCMPGVVKKCDHAVLEKLVLDGKLNAAAARLARTDTFETARIMGPSEIKIKL